IGTVIIRTSKALRMLASTSALTEFGKASRASGHARRDRLARRRNRAGDNPPSARSGREGTHRWWGWRSTGSPSCPDRSAPHFRRFIDTGLDNGLAERFNRTMKEQAIHGRIFKNLEEARAATIAFRDDRYNRDRRLGEPGFKSALEARQERLMKLAARAAKACPNNRSRYMQRWPYHSQQTTHNTAADDAQRRSMQVNDPASPPGAVGVGITPNVVASKLMPPASADTNLARPHL